jgi:hypothetical protein
MTELNPNEIRTVSPTGGEKGVKPERHSLIPVEALNAIARLYAKGAEKYDAHNWRRGYDWSKSYDALHRHAAAFWSGEDIDPEMGESHMAAVAFHAMTLLVFQLEQPEFDDRYIPERVQEPMPEGSIPADHPVFQPSESNIYPVRRRREEFTDPVEVAEINVNEIKLKTYPLDSQESHAL